MSNQPLFTPYRMGELDLPNRIVMAPLTRMRVQPHDHVPTVLQAEYYAQRASAGLIIAEATAISSEGFGWAIRQDCGHRSRSADGDASRMPFMQQAAASLHNSGTRERSRILNYGMARSLYPHRTSIQAVLVHANGKEADRNTALRWNHSRDGTCEKARSDKTSIMVVRQTKPKRSLRALFEIPAGWSVP
jgi:2,4-dienoyl-CoA reductase-like NADH-dependent reductase (Old Yellow Enzyme family)